MAFDEEEIEDSQSTPEVLQRFITQYKEHITGTQFYIESRNWGRKTEEALFTVLKNEHNIEWKLVKAIATRLEYFIKEAEGNLHRKFAIEFIKLLKGLLEGYIERSNIYRKLNRWAEIEDNDTYMDEQITFQDDLLSNINTLRKVMSKINLDETKGEIKNIPIHGDKKVPFLMKEIIEKRFPKQFS